MWIYLINLDSFDCTSDPCHLSWFIKDNRHLLKAVSFAYCSNGTRFEDLDPNAYSKCTVTDINVCAVLTLY